MIEDTKMRMRMVVGEDKRRFVGTEIQATDRAEIDKEQVREKVLRK